MKTLLKNFAVFMAVILALSTFGFDVQAVAADLDQEMQTVETLQSETEELEVEPEEPDTNPGNAEDETQEEPEAPETDPTLEADEPEETVPTESLEDQEDLADPGESETDKPDIEETQSKDADTLTANQILGGGNGDTTNHTSVRVSKSWVGVKQGTNPIATIELFDADDPNTVIKTAMLTPTNTSIIWHGLPYSKGNPATVINYQIREVGLSGYQSSVPVKTPATIDSIVRTTPNNNLDWPIQQPSFVVTKPTQNAPYIIWTLNHLPVSERATFIANFHSAAATHGANLGPFGSLSLSDDIVWIEGAVVNYDIFPSDSSIGLIQINVTFDANGAIASASLNYQNQPSWTQFIVGTYSAEEFTLTNTYSPEPVDVDLGGTKNLTGRTLEDGEFEFGLYESNSNGVAGTLIEAVSNDGTDFDFSTLTFNYGDEGTYYYLIKEIEGGLGGVTYDKTEYLVKVVVTDDGEGNLEAAVTYSVFDKTQKKWVAAQTIVFNNDYEAADVDVDLEGTKNLEGRDLADGEFDFILYESDEYGNVGPPIQTVSNVGAIFSFNSITFEDGEEGIYYYLIKEAEGALGGVTYDPTEYHVKVIITDDGEGSLEAGVSYWILSEIQEAWIQVQTVVFNNDYLADDVDVVLGGAKNLEGRDIANGEFEFELYKSDENGVVGTLVEKVSNVGGYFTFSALTFVDGEEGIHYFLLREVEGTLGGVTYDLTKYLIVITVADNGIGNLYAGVSYRVYDESTETWDSSGAPVFNNDYLATDVDVDLGGMKNLEGRDLADGEFEFNLYKSDVNGVTGEQIETVSNVGTAFSFTTLTFEDGEEGTFYYLIKEVLDGLGGVTYDSSEYLVEVIITDDGVGNLQAEVSYLMLDETDEWLEVETAVFNNDYLADDVDVDLGGTKNLEGRDLTDGEFEFSLYKSDDFATTGALIQTVSNLGADFSFSTITFEDGDEGYYYYLIKEVGGSLGGVTYDSNEYLVEVIVTDDGIGNLHAEVSYWMLDETEEWVEVETAVFNNDYLATDVDVDLGGMKNLEGRDLADGEFEFNLYKSDEYGVTGAQIETVSNVGTAFSFSTLSFEDGEEGTYYYLIKEVLGGLGGITYDYNEYLVEVIITDDGVGNLHAEVSYWMLDETEEWVEVETAVFNNDYLAAGVYVILGGMKNLEGRDLADGEFEFNLYKSDEYGITGAQIETISNTGQYFDFSPLSFEDGEEGTYYYLIKEVLDGLGGITYDYSEYLVEVIVTDDGVGNLQATISYLMLDETEEWVEVKAVVFNNDYEAADVEIDLGGTKVLEGRDLIDGEFEFELYDLNISLLPSSILDLVPGTLIETVSNVGANFSFSPITFVDGDEGTYSYLIKEVNGGLGGVTYDSREYLVEVIITDDGLGNLHAEVSYWIMDETEEWIEVEAVVFNNDYLAADVDVDLEGMKILEGRELIDGEFEFNLYESDESASTGALLETVSNMGPYFDFSTITFSDGEEGIYLYLIKEVAAMLGGVSYDFTEYLVQVEITDDGEGNLVAEVSYLTLDETETWRDVEAVVFNNDYVALDVDVDLGGAKALEGRDLIDGEFEFALYEFSESGNDALIETVSNVGPVFSFSPITFADGDEGYYYYLIKEVVGTLDGVMYDLTEYMVEVFITDNGEGQLEAEVSYWIVDETQEEWIAVEAVVFSNRYINPELEVEKMVEETSFSEAGDELHYSFEVTNTGNLAFIKLTVNDPRLGIVDLVIDLTDPLLPGESYIHEFTVPYVVTEEDVEAAAPIINTLTVVGETEEGFEDEDEDDVIVPFEQIDPIIPPILALEKLAHEKSFAKAGDLIHYYFELTNEGIVPIVKLTVNDPKLGIEDLVIDLGDDPLMPGDTLTYEFAEAYVVTEADVAAGKVENVLTVIGESPDGAEDEVTDDLVVPMEKILPHVPSTGEYISRWTAIGSLILGGAVALILINRRRKLNQS